MRHATSYGPDWPFTPKRREKKPAASSRRRSHGICFRVGWLNARNIVKTPDLGGLR
jgi:hypothetical protein